MTIEQANQYFAALPDGFASTEQLRAAFTAPVQKVQFVGVAGTAGKTTVAALLAATLRAAGIHAGLYHAGCEPLSVRVRVDGAPVDEGLLCLAAEAQAAAEPLPQDAAELAAAAYAFGEAGCALAVVELPDAGLAEAPDAGVRRHLCGPRRRQPLGGAAGRTGGRGHAQGLHLRHRTGAAQSGAQRAHRGRRQVRL